MATVATTTAPVEVRPLSVIAREIRRTWKPVNFGAVPYLNAMSGMGAVTDITGCEDGKTMVLYFLSNAGTWRGDDARRIKAELKRMINMK